MEIETGSEVVSSICMVLESNAMFEIVFEDSMLATERLDESPIGSGTAVAPMLMFEVAHPIESPDGVFGR